MLKFDERLYEILLVCSYSGKIKKVLHNSLRFEAFPIIGQSIINLSEETSKANLLNCLHTTIDFHQSNKCEVNFIVGKKRYLMGVAAKRIDSNNLLIGMISTLDSINMYEDMMKINNESINELRRLAKERVNKRKYKDSAVDNSKNKQNLLNNISMNNYLEVIKENEENYSNYTEVLKKTIDIVNYFAAFKNIKVELISDKFISCINYEEHLIQEELNSLLSIILKYVMCDSTILISMNQWQEVVILDIEFKIKDKIDNILNDEGYIFVQDVVESNEGMIWYEDNENKIKFYVLEPLSR